MPGSAAVAPQLAAVEAHRVEVLRILAAVVSMVVGKDHGRMLPDHDADAAARVRRQPRVAGRLMVLCAHPLADANAGAALDCARIRVCGRTPFSGLPGRGPPPPGPRARIRASMSALVTMPSASRVRSIDASQRP